MNYAELLKQLSANALLWTGIAAIALTLMQGSFYFVLFFVGLVALNVVFIALLNHFAPNILREEFRAGEGGNIAFKFSPLKYPKVLDEETRQYVPEFIHIDIRKDNKPLFSGNMARQAVKQFSETINQALSAREPPKLTSTTTLAPTAPQITPKKKTRKKS